MITNGRFEGKLHDKEIGDFLSQLDYELNQQERLELVDRIVNTQIVGDKKFPDEFFEDFFEQKDLKNGVNTSHIKLCASKKDNLSTENEVCKALERMADYILYAPDAERLTKKTVYNFYSEDNMNKKINKEKSTDNIANTLKIGDVGSEEIIDFLKKKGENFKKKVVQKILSKDLLDEQLDCVRDYEDAKNGLRIIMAIALEEGDTRTRIRCGNQIASMSDDQIMCKNYIKGTIYFKQCMADSTVPDYTQFDYSNPDHVSALLKVRTLNDFDSDLFCMTYDLDKYVRLCEFTDTEKEVLLLWRDRDATQDSIAKAIGIKQQSVNKALHRICNKIMEVYNEEYEDWYYLNVEKGVYKRCTKCGTVKLVSKFGKRANSKDGLRSYCNVCRQGE
jgi:hypothetical protein